MFFRYASLKKSLFFLVILLPYLALSYFYTNSKGKQPEAFDSLWNEIFEQSEHQKLIKRNVLVITAKFMIKEVKEDDPELIEFVKSLIVKPSTEEYNLKDKGKSDFSQIGQSKYMDGLLKSKRNGFFVEAGAYDGEQHSNTLFFEMERGYEGLLIEPIPSLYQSVISKKRKSYAINACIANEKPIIAKFRLMSVLSSRLSQMSKDHEKRMNLEQGKNKVEYAYVPCFSFNTIMKAMNVSTVDYFSLDVEGGEWDVLKSLDYSKIDIKSFSIEHNGNNEIIPKIQSFLKRKNYEETKIDPQDYYFLKK